MLRFQAGIIAAALLAITAGASSATAAQLAAPKRTSSTCTTYDHFPMQCGYVFQLTADELKTVQGFHQQHVEEYKAFASDIAAKASAPNSAAAKSQSSESAAAAKLPAPQRTPTKCTTFDHFPPVCGYVGQLTDDELRIVQGFHQQHVQAYQNFEKATK
jgi:hypothetical protein